jgi:hypothetical protein
MADELDHYRQLLMDNRCETHPLATEARAALAQPESSELMDEEVVNLVERLRYPIRNDGFVLNGIHWRLADGTIHHAKTYLPSAHVADCVRAADLLERLAGDNAGLAAAADSLWADNMSLLDSHHD